MFQRLREALGSLEDRLSKGATRNRLWAPLVNQVR